MSVVVDDWFGVIRSLSQLWVTMTTILREGLMTAPWSSTLVTFGARRLIRIFFVLLFFLVRLQLNAWHWKPWANQAREAVIGTNLITSHM